MSLLINNIKQKLGFQSKVPLEQRLSKEAVISLCIHSIFQFGASMSGLFLNLYLWRLTEDFVINALFNLIGFAFTPVAFALGGYVAKKFDRMVVYRLGIIFIAIFYLLVIISGEAVPQFYVAFAVLNGISSGLYWVGYLILQYDVSTNANRLRYLSINLVSFYAAGLAGPALAGFVIQRMDGLSGYIIIFALSFLMFVVAAFISMKISRIHNHHKSYYLKYMGLIMKKSKTFLYSLYSFLILGLFQGVMLFLPNILLFRVLEREDLVGYFGVLFALITVLTGFVLSKILRPEHTRLSIVMSAVGVSIGSIFVLMDVALWSIIVFMTMFSIFNPLVFNTVTNYYYRLIGELPLKGQLKIESVVVRELFINIGRVLSTFIMIVFANNLNSIQLPLLLVVLAFSQFFVFFLVKTENTSAQGKRHRQQKQLDMKG